MCTAAACGPSSVWLCVSCAPKGAGVGWGTQRVKLYNTPPPSCYPKKKKSILSITRLWRFGVAGGSVPFALGSRWWSEEQKQPGTGKRCGREQARPAAPAAGLGDFSVLDAAGNSLPDLTR